jgi:hypothetical protein
MKTLLKLGMLGTMMIGGVAAHAAAIVPSTGDGSLVFVLTDTKTNQTFTDVLTQDVNSYLSAAQTTTPAPTGGVINTVTGDAGFTVSLSSDPNLVSFLATAGTDPLNWAVMGGAWSGSGNALRPTGAARYITTDSEASPYPAIVAVSMSSITTGMTNGFGADITQLNTNLGATAHSTTNGVFGTAQSADPNELTFYGSGIPVGGLVPSSTAVTLFGLSGNGHGSGAAYAYSLGTISYDGSTDTLTFTGNGSGPPPVPLPAAVWLLGSGLLGLAGVSRRRAASAA